MDHRDEVKKSLQAFGLSKERIYQLFTLHDRKFSPIPKGYPKPEYIINQLISLVMQRKPELYGLELKAADEAACVIIHELTEHPEYPWYWLSKDLVTDLSLTDRPDAIPSTIALPRCSVIVLPNKTLKTSTGYVDFFCYDLVSRADVKADGIEDANMDFHLAWCAVEAYPASYINAGLLSLSFSDRSLKINYGDYDPTINPTVDSEKDIELCASVLLNILVYAQAIEPEVFAAERTRKVGFGTDSTRSIPLFIGKDYQPAYNTEKGTGSHASPAVHWRRGHWHRYAVGKGRKERAWRFVQPQLINVKPDKEEVSSGTK